MLLPAPPAPTKQVAGPPANLSAIRMQPEERLYPIVIAWLGLASCLFLAFWVEPMIWVIGLALCATGLVWWSVANALRRNK